MLSLRPENCLTLFYLEFLNPCYCKKIYLKNCSAAIKFYWAPWAVSIGPIRELSWVSQTVTLAEMHCCTQTRARSFSSHVSYPIFLPKSQKCCTKTPRGKKIKFKGDFLIQTKSSRSQQLTFAIWSNLPNSSFNMCTSSPGEQSLARRVNPTISAYKMLQQKWTEPGSQLLSAGLKLIKQQQNLKANSLGFTGICPYPKKPLLNVEQ